MELGDDGGEERGTRDVTHARKELISSTTQRNNKTKQYNKVQQKVGVITSSVCERTCARVRLLSVWACVRVRVGTWVRGYIH